MSGRKMRMIAWCLCLALVLSVLPPVTPMADTVSGNEIPAEEKVEYKNTYMDIEEEMLDEDRMPRVLKNANGQERAVPLPVSYRSDQVSQNGVRVSYLPKGFRNQSPYGTCWAFAALGACEASMIRKGLATEEIDLSERHLAYYFYNKGATGDSKGGTYGDYNMLNRALAGLAADENYLDAGGNSTYTMWHLASWCGPVAESAAPYEGLVTSGVDEAGLMGKTNSTFDAYGNDALHVQNVYKIALGDMKSMRSYKDTVKEMIMKYGALAFSYYSDYLYDAPEYDSYYNFTEEDTNHAVQVVGWDDNFPKENFVIEAPGDGAWLIKNSWGEESDYQAQNGYFWLSYYDLSVNAYRNAKGETVMRYAYVYDAEPADNYDNIYQYDGDSMAGWLTLPADMNIANRFTVKNGKGLWEAVRSVGIGVAQSNVRGTVEIYSEMTGTAGNPTEGTLMHSQRIDLQYPGHHTIKLSKPVYVGDGQQFSVVFKFDQETDVNISYDYDSWVRFITYDNPYVSYWKSDDGCWYDLADDAYIFRIKAYTDETNYRPPMLNGISLKSVKEKLVAGKKVQLVSTQNVTPGSDPAEKRVWKENWITTDPSVATVSDTGVVTAVKPGTAIVMVSAGKWNATCTITVTPKKTTISSISLTSKGKAKLKWKKQNGVSGYQIYRATSENGTYKKVKTVSSASTVTATLAANKGSKPYYFKVRAYKTVNGKKEYGEFSSIKTCAPKKPTGVKVTAQKGKKAKVKWKTVSQASGYEIYRATKKKGTYKKVKTITKKKTVSFTNKSLKKGKTYYYKVRAYRLMGGKKVYGPYSDIVKVKAKK